MLVCRVPPHKYSSQPSLENYWGLHACMQGPPPKYSSQPSLENYWGLQACMQGPTSQI